jgi:hypothetical protein
MPARANEGTRTTLYFDAESVADIASLERYYAKHLKLRLSTSAIVRRALSNLVAHTQKLANGTATEILVEKAIAGGHQKPRYGTGRDRRE